MLLVPVVNLFSKEFIDGEIEKIHNGEHDTSMPSIIIKVEMQV